MASLMVPAMVKEAGGPGGLTASGSEGGWNCGQPDGLPNVRRPELLVASTTSQGTGRSESSMV